MKILIGIAGLPGSGKSTLMDLFDRRTVHIFDDINRDWKHGIEAVRDRLNHNESVVVSDIIFCEKRWRIAFENAVGMKAQWICFENAPEKAQRNARKRNRSTLNRELSLIDGLSKTFESEPLMIYETTESRTI